MNGWIKLNRKILDWQWYDNKNTFKIFIHLLLKANIETKKWHKEEIKRGQLITSIEHLSKEVGLTYQQTRTAISKLKSTGEITVKTTNKFSLVTVVNYNDYQDKKEETTGKTTDKSTNNQQTNNKQITTTKEYKNNKEDKKDIEQEFLELWKLYPNKKGKATAFLSYKRLRKKDKDLYSKVKHGIEAYAEEEKKKGTQAQYIKHGSTFFNQKIWEDYENVPVKKKTQRHILRFEEDYSEFN